MSAESDKRDPIKPPEKDHPDDKVREAALATVEAIPILGGTLARLAEASTTSQAEKARSIWEGKISGRTNENTTRLDQHEQVLAPTETIGGTTAQLIEALARDCPDGMGDKDYELNDLCALLTETNRQQIEDAAFELQSFGVVDIERGFGDPWWLRLTPSFFEQFDCQIMGWNTLDDAKVVARLILERNTGIASELHQGSGWERRRFNPAFQYLLQLLPAERISGELQPTYPTTQVLILPEDRAVLRRFLS